jgi:photosystem II stability/assembly factor-like uncharacterized protein
MSGRGSLRALGTVLCLTAVVGVPGGMASGQGTGAGMVPSNYLSGLDYRMIGPARGGRATTVAGHRDQPGSFYMGASGGGVWKTDDYGSSWRNVSDGFFTTGSIGSIRVAPSDANVVYVGTGSDGIRSNVIIGRGAFRSSDAGETWTPVGLVSAGQIGAIEVHPTDPNTVVAAALGSPFGKGSDRGIYKTTDGGSSWRQVLFTSDSVGGIDVEYHPTNPDILYAAMWRGERKPWTIISGMEASAEEDGIWRSVDGGESWQRMSRGLPTGLIGKIDFAVSPSDPDRVYALVETREPEEGLYRSDDAGESWRLINNQRQLMDRPFYYTNVDADPSDADNVYVSATQFWVSNDAGEGFERLSTPHGDNHDLWINPDDPTLWIQSNDGGATVTRDGGRTWSTQGNQATAELYQVHTDDRFPYWVYSGQQDNTTIMVPSLPPEESSLGGAAGLWKAVGGCETGPAVPKPGDPNTVYSNCKGRFGVYSHRTGQERQYYVGAVNLYGTNPANLPYRFQRVVPIEVSPHDPNTVYHGSQFVHRTTDGGVTWVQISPDLTAFPPERQMVSGGPITRDATGEEHFSTLYVIEESPLEPGVIWTGANDGRVSVTRDGGDTWTTVTPPDLPPEGRIQSIDVSPHREGKAYFAAYRYQLNDFEPYIYRTLDYGRNWTRLTDGTNGIPADEPTRVVREDPDREGLLYAGTEFGMFVSLDDGAAWQSFQLDLPVTPVTDIKVVDQDLVISTMGRSFWILDNLTPLHQYREGLATKNVTLLQPQDAYRMRYGGGFRFGPTPSGAPEYVGAGAELDYVLGEDAGEVTVQILDDSGQVVRGYSSAEGGYQYEDTQEMRAPMTRRSGGPRVATSAGLHRLRWDLRHNPKMAGRGPMAVPGRYTVRVSADGVTAEKSFALKVDPRVEADGVTPADLEEQLALNLRLRDVITEARGALADLEVAKERIGDPSELESEAQARAEAALAELMAVEAAMVTKSGGSYQTPMLVAQLNYLYGMTSRADQRPGRDAYLRLEVLESELQRHVAVLRRILGTPIADPEPMP